MCKNISNAPANCHRSGDFTKVRCVLVLINSTVFMAEYLQPQMNCRDS